MLTKSCFGVLAVLSYHASAQSVTLWQFDSPTQAVEASADDGIFTSAWLEPIGTAENGEETTYIFNAVVPVEATGTELYTYSGTLAAGASAINYPSQGFECTLTAPDSGECVAEVDADDGSSFLTVTQGGLTASPYVVAVSTPAPTGTGGSASSGAPAPTGGSGSVGGGSGSGSGSSATSASVSTPSNAALPGRGGGGVSLVVAAGVVAVGVVSGFMF